MILFFSIVILSGEAAVKNVPCKLTPHKYLHFIQTIQVQIINFSKDFLYKIHIHNQWHFFPWFLAQNPETLSLFLFTSHRSTGLCPVCYPLHIELHIWFKISPHRGLLSYHQTLWQCICHLLKYHSSIQMKTLWTARENIIKGYIVEYHY